MREYVVLKSCGLAATVLVRGLLEKLLLHNEVCQTFLAGHQKKASHNVRIAGTVESYYKIQLLEE